MNGNVTKEGITADLEAMKRVGIGGAQIFNVAEGIPARPGALHAPAVARAGQARRRRGRPAGLELCLHNCAGWSSSGGPWIKPEHAMQTVVTSETRVKGPAPFRAVLPQPKAKHDYYRDIAVLAFPTPESGRRSKISKARSMLEPVGSIAGKIHAGPAINRDQIVDLTKLMRPTAS